MASNEQLSPSLQLWAWDTTLWLRVQAFSWYRCPVRLLTDWNKLNGNPKNSTKFCSERPGRKLEAPQPYSFVGRDGSPQEHLQMVTVSGSPVKAMLKIHLVCRKEFTSKRAAGLSQRNALPTTASSWVILLEDLSVLVVNMYTNIGSRICTRENKGKNLLVSYSSWVNLWVLPPSWVAVSYNIVQSAASLNNSCCSSRHWAHHWNPIKLLSPASWGAESLGESNDLESRRITLLAQSWSWIFCRVSSFTVSLILLSSQFPSSSSSRIDPCSNKCGILKLHPLETNCN